MQVILSFSETSTTLFIVLSGIATGVNLTRGFPKKNVFCKLSCPSKLNNEGALGPDGFTNGLAYMSTHRVRHTNSSFLSAGINKEPSRLSRIEGTRSHRDLDRRFGLAKIPYQVNMRLSLTTHDRTQKLLPVPTVLTWTTLTRISPFCFAPSFPCHLSQ